MECSAGPSTAQPTYYTSGPTYYTSGPTYYTSGPTTYPNPSLSYSFDSCTSPRLTVSGAHRSSVCGGYQGSPALTFKGGSGTRQVTTQYVSMPSGGVVTFYHRLGSGGSCETVDSGEGVVMEYQRSGSTSWTQLFSSNSNLAYYKTMRRVSVSVSGGGSFRFRWRQLGHSGSSYDHWMVDQIQITGGGLFLFMFYVCVCV